MHGNQWVLKIAVLKYYSVSKRGTTAKSNPKQATDPLSLHTKFGDNSSNTFPLNERKPCVTPDIDAGHRTPEKAKIIYPPPRGADIINIMLNFRFFSWQYNHFCMCTIALKWVKGTNFKGTNLTGDQVLPMKIYPVFNNI